MTKRTFAIVGLLALLSRAAFGQAASGQTTAPAPKFDIADVHTSTQSTNRTPFMTGGALRGGRYDLRDATMLDLIRTAYGVDADTVLGGPNWLELDRFDVSAKAPPATSPETLRLMLQALLADRFQLVVHRDTKPLQAFALTLEKGKSRLKEADGSGSTGCQFEPQKPEPGTVPFMAFSCHSMTMTAFAGNLRRIGGDYLTGPVVDSTGLEGAWDFDIRWTYRALLGQAGGDGVTLFDAVEKQLGLKLEPRKTPEPVIVVDSVSGKLSANPPEVTRSLPPAPTEFEVAVIRPSMPDETPFFRVHPGGQVEIGGFTLKFLIASAWNLDPRTNEMMVGAPKFLDSERFDITAEASSDSAPANGAVDSDDLRLMLQALLKDRFKLATHMEDRPVTAYTLMAVKPKLKRADPANRTGWKEGPGPDGKDPRNENPILSRLVTCRNMSMTQFAELLPKIASGYIQSPVLDATGMEGGWDFTLSFSAAGLLHSRPGQGGDAGQAAGGAAASTLSASDPSGAVSLFDAVKQLGLKLEMQKRPVPVLVIDHVEEKPTDN